MGKTAVFVISILNQVVPGENDAYEPHQAIVTCHTRELAHQIYKDFKRLGNSGIIQVDTSRNQSYVMDATSVECLYSKTKQS